MVMWVPFEIVALPSGFDSDKRIINPYGRHRRSSAQRSICRRGVMKYVPLILCASMTIWSAPSSAQTKQSPLMQPGASILTLNKMCQEKINTSQYAICVAYLRGLFDGMQQAKLVDTTKDTFCPPATPDLDQLRLIIDKWVHDNPTETKVTVGFAAPMAFSLAFPCD
jgi:hypothetical protein